MNCRMVISESHPVCVFDKHITLPNAKDAYFRNSKGDKMALYGG